MGFSVSCISLKRFCWIINNACEAFELLSQPQYQYLNFIFSKLRHGKTSTCVEKKTSTWIFFSTKNFDVEKKAKYWPCRIFDITVSKKKVWVGSALRSAGRLACMLICHYGYPCSFENYLKFRAMFLKHERKP